jgi:hypothetical protein
LTYSDNATFGEKGHFFVRRINLRGLELDVEFRFYQGIPATKDEPESPEELMIEAVFLDEYDIMHIIGNKTFLEIEKEIYKLYDDKEDVC